MVNNLIITAPWHSDIDSTIVGGKAYNLIKLSRQAIPVPSFFCVSAHAFSTWLEQKVIADIQQQLTPEKNPDIHQLASQLLEKLSQMPLSAILSDHVLTAFDHHFKTSKYVSVRSSAIDEDSLDDSFAGQMDSYLYVTRENLLERLQQCFISAFSERAIHYRLQKQRPLSDITFAVVIQEMVASCKSGVMFTANPINKSFDELLITAGFGLGEGIVEGKVEVDTYYIDKTHHQLKNQSIEIKTKQVKHHQQQGHGVHIVTVDPAQQKQSVLAEPEWQQLFEMGLTIERHYGYPQDIEWGIAASGKLYILQTRPITTLPKGGRTIFDNTNINENYPGVITPLTFSYTRWLYEVVSRRSAKALGATQKSIDSNPVFFKNFVGLLNGHIYYNMTHWYGLYSLLPGLDKNIPVWEKTFALKKDSQLTQSSRINLADLKTLLAKIRVFSHVIYQFFALAKKSTQFHDDFIMTSKIYHQRPLHQLSLDELIQLCETITERTLNRGEITIINDFFTFIYFNGLESVLNKYNLNKRNNLLNDLLTSEQNMSSVAPVKSILAITEKIRQHPAATELFQQNDLPAIWVALQTQADYQNIKAKLDEYLQLFGDRMAEELKLELPSPLDDPTLLINMIKSYLQADTRFESLSQTGQKKRKDAENHLNTTLNTAWLKRKLVFWLLKGSRKGIAQRENYRFSRMQMFGMTRRIFLQIGQQFQNVNIIEQVDDIFFLTLEEVTDFIRGCSVTRSFSEIITLRKKEYQHFAQQEISTRITTYGAVNTNRFSDPNIQIHDHSDQALKGVGCGGGKITAPVKIVLNPAQAGHITGQILVAKMTDPGWVFLMIAAKGLISEQGNVLSHTAIIGRELGIPTVVGVNGVLRQLKDGQQVILDGELGTIEIVKPDQEDHHE